MVSRQVLQKQEPGCPEHLIAEPADGILVWLSIWDALQRGVDVSLEM